MAACGWCATSYETWPEGGCPNCGCGEPAPDAAEPDADAAGLAEVDTTEAEIDQMAAEGTPAQVVAEVPGNSGTAENGAAGTSVPAEPPVVAPVPAKAAPTRPRAGRRGRGGGSG